MDARHFKPRLVYFLPHFSRPFIIKSGYKSIGGYNGACTVDGNSKVVLRILNKFQSEKHIASTYIFFYILGICSAIVTTTTWISITASVEASISSSALEFSDLKSLADSLMDKVMSMCEVN